MRDIYLDSAANTCVDKRVFEAMKPYLSQKFMGNAFAIHTFGIQASTAVEYSRQQAANLFNVTPQEVYFTSGATEGNNWVLMGLALNELKKEKRGEACRKKIICSSVEHSSVLKVCNYLEQLGFNVQYLKPDSYNGFKKAIDTQTLIVCCMSVNNELGTKYDVDKIADLAKKHGALFLCDCTQLVSYGGKYLDIQKFYPHVDYFTFSSHKIYGPTGVGCLIARSESPLYPYIIGGSQEQGLRGGTSNTAGIVGLGKACALMQKADFKSFYEKLYDKLILLLQKKHINYTLTVEKDKSVDHFNIISLRINDIRNDNLANTLAMYGIAVSAGSACDNDHIGVFNPSHVLVGLNLSGKQIKRTIRISFNKFTTVKDLKIFVHTLKEIIRDEKTNN